MASFHNILVLLFLLSAFLSYSTADDSTGNYCNPNTVITSTSLTSANIDSLLAELVSPFKKGGNFARASYGKTAASKVYGLAQCRGDVGAKDCLSCIQEAAQEVRKLCPNQADARIWYDYCFLRYSPDKFYNNVDTSFGMLYANVENVTDPASFNQKLGKLFKKLDSVAPKPSSRGLAKDKTKLTSFETLYGLAQCTRDLSPLNCAQCLAIAIQNFQGFCSEKKGCRVFYSSCFVRYELYPFYFPLDSVKTKGGSSVEKSVIHG